MNFQISFLRRVRIHGGECGAVARALHHEVERNSLPAVIEKVSFTTFERKQMTKLTFKRIALVVVAALGFGVLATGPSSGAMIASSDTLTISATTSTISAGETASVTVTQTVIAAAAGDSIGVTVTDQSSPTSGDGTLGFYVTDSSNATIRTTANNDAAAKAKLQVDYTGAAGTAYTSDVQAFAGGTSALSATYRLSFMAPTVAGTYVFRLYALQGTNSSGTYAPVAAPLTWTVTVSANTSDVATTASKYYLNRLAEYNAHNLSVDASTNTYKGLEADSALVVNAGALRTAANYTAVAVIYPVIMNSSDTKISSRTGARVQDSFTVTINGAGQLAGHARFTGQSTAYSKQVTVAYNESVVVFSDGSVGTATITGYVGATSASTAALTQGTKSITFTGKATSFTVDGYSTAIRAGGSVKYTGAADSQNATTAFRFQAKDAAGNVVTTASLNTDPGQAAFYAISSDTSVLAAGEGGSTWSANASRRSPSLTCTLGDGTTAKPSILYWYCDGRFYDSGTVTVTIVDSQTVTGNGTPLSTTTSAVVKSSAFTITVASNGVGTAAFNKTTYAPAEAATLTLTCKDSGGRIVADGSHACWSGLNWTGSKPTFSSNSSANAAGGTFTDLETYLGTNTFVLGTDTALVFMPTTAGTYTLNGRTAGATTDSVVLTFTVVDPNATAIAAAQSAADAATDAANEAIDAANAATDAANIAAEAADAATVAAEEARDAADAATAAVEELATQVATLMAALSAQVKTLANTVAKIAKKVKA
jgi:hypothetical protein